MKDAPCVLLILVLLATVWSLGATGVLADSPLEIEGRCIRTDRYTIPLQQWQWAEAWGEIRQYFPRYFQPSATLHLFVRNTSKREVDITRLSFNDRPIDEACTKPDFAGPVIWYRSNPDVLQPGEYGMIYARLREAPAESITLSVMTDSGESLQADFSAQHQDQIRLGYVGFSQAIDRMYIYADNLTDSNLRVDGVYLDGVDLTDSSDLVNANFKGGPALIETQLETPLAYGSFHCLKVTTKQGPVAMHQIRARDARFYLGMVGGDVGRYRPKLFNTIYELHGNHPAEPNWWDPESNVAQWGFRYIRPGTNEAVTKAGATVPPGVIIYNGKDEPDAHEGGTLPYMQRCGVNAMQQVEPPMKLQRRHDPHHDTMTLLDRTYAPMNWYTYGELPDILMNDCYAPSQWMGYELTPVFPATVRTVMHASAPRPVHMMLWGGMNTGYPMRRASTPEENDMAVHHVIGEGAKGVYYFQWNSYPRAYEGGYFVGAPRATMQWKNIGRMNAEITRLAPLLNRGYPFQIARTDNDMLSVRSLLCGKDAFVVVCVNKNHRIHANDRYTKQPHIVPVKQAAVSIDLPGWFKPKAAVHVTYDGAKPVKLTKKLFSRTRTLHIADLKTSMVVVISTDPDIAKLLTVPEEQYAALLESEKPTYVTASPPIADCSRPDNVINLDELAGDGSSVTLHLTDPDTVARASRITTAGELRLEAGKWLGLFTARDWHGQAEIVFTVSSATPFAQITATLDSSTPNFPACANNVVGLSLDGIHYAEDCSFKVEWNGGDSGERLTVTLSAPEDKPLKQFYLRVMLRDPGIVFSDQATNLARSVQLSWQRLKD